jgi:hypothetical protein
MAIIVDDILLVLLNVAARAGAVVLLDQQSANVHVVLRLRTRMQKSLVDAYFIVATGLPLSLFLSALACG